MRQAIPQTPAEAGQARVVERPDGFYWHSPDGGREYGPFATLREAMQDMELASEETLEEGESLAEAEEEIGLSGWIDPETGEPAEDTVTRIEEH
ncbi:MAG: hypothetical protein ACK5YW_03895 [Betaproteobacteria bacterium]|jgi:hypothetical protein|nr:hypothetical protein [Rhodocyclaceae bacterium]MCA3135767.1 hypothetical protein [Rhodocyclaceae bacterium]MCA3142528.1 hypothetical protein [Rhodocyclaceae bacterium]MCA3145895.1 hypothetical protein [Rhodocyclaceae bacterium]MCE2898696.1 hypothetical protein [Betaproteobacteria bacterium]